MNYVRVLVSTLAVVVLLSTSAGYAAKLKYVKSVTADLDGNGTKEKAYLRVSKDRAKPSVLHVGTLSADVNAESPEGLAIVDIDSKDRFKEIIVNCGNPYDGGSFGHVYEYDGKSLKKLGVLEREPQFTGHGIIYAQSWTCSFMIRKKFALNSKTRQIEEIRQPMYYIGKSFKAEKSFPVFLSPTDTSIVANVEPKSQVLIIAVAFQPVKQKTTDPNKYETFEQWYLVKTHSGLMGWVRDQDAMQHLGIPAAG